MTLDERLHDMPGWMKSAILLLCGCITALALPPAGHYLAALFVFGMTPVFFIVPNVRSPRQAAFFMWAFGFGYFLVALRWLVEPFQVEADLFGWMAPFALALMAAGLALFWAAAGWAALRLAETARARVIALVVALAMAELARAYVLTGFPWAGFAQITVDKLIGQVLAQIGPHGVGVLLLVLVALPAFWRSAAGTSAAVGAFACVLFPLSLADPDSPSKTDHTIRIVQPNAPQHQKWDPDYAALFFWRQVEATREGETKPDLIVWPETAIPQLYNDAEETLKIVTEAAQGVPVVLGMQRADLRGYYNSMLVLDGTGDVTQVYDKHHLVPFGEYMPLQWFFGLLGIEAIAQRFDTGYQPGPGPTLIDLGPLGSALPLICYEAVFPQHSRSPNDRPAFLLQITNDAWFGTYAGPQQHLAQARMRAIEQGLPLVRSANTGISAMIDPFGRIINSIPLGEHGFVDAKLPMPRDPTLYSRTGDWPVAVLLLMALLALIWRRLTMIND